MQCTSYLHGCYPNNDLNIGANGNRWPPYYGDGTQKSTNLYNDLSPTFTTNQNLWHVKEILSQTILKHEATFRNQVLELHRLYRRQRELMEEIRLREKCEHHLRLQTFQSNLVFPQMPSEVEQKMWHISSLPWENPAGNCFYALNAENVQAFSSFVAGNNMKADCEPSLSKSHKEDCNLSLSRYALNAENVQAFSSFVAGNNVKADCEPSLSKSHKEDCNLSLSQNSNYGKRMLDLELPADEYIDSEEEERSKEKEVSEVPEVPYYPSKRISGSVVFSGGQGGPVSPDSFSRKTKHLVDLNEPIQLDDRGTPNSTSLLGSDTCHVEIPYKGHNLSGMLNSDFLLLNQEIVHTINAGKGFQDYSKMIYDRQQELQTYNDEAGKSGSNLSPLFQVSCQERLSRSCVELQGHERPRINLLDKVDQEMWSERTNLELKIPERNHNLCNDNYPVLVSYSIPTSNQLVTQSDVAKSEPSSVPSQRKAIHNLRHIPIAVQALPCVDTRTSLTKNSFHPSRNSTCSPRFESVPNSFSPEFQSKSMTLKAFSPLTSLNPLTRTGHNNSPSKHHDLSESFKDSTRMGVNFNSMRPSCLLDTTVSRENNRIAGVGKKPEDSVEGSHWFRAKSDSNSKLDEETQHLAVMESVFSHPFENGDFENREKMRVHDSWAAPDSSLDSGNCGTDDVAVHIGVANKVSDFCNHIDLNSLKIEDESSLAPATPTLVMKIAPGMDLEAPVSPENKECSPPRGESEEHQLETPSKQEDRDPETKLARTAAEAIFLISASGVPLCLDNATGKQSEASGDCLNWFSGIVCSMAGELEKEVETFLTGAADGDHNEILPNVIDNFDTMTLKPTEMEVEEYCCKRTRQTKNVTRPIFISSQQRTVQTRRARRRKDFQTESADTTMVTGSRRRNVGKNGCARGKRQSRSNGTQHTMYSLLKQQTNFNELGFREGCSVTGWGKNNRRRRGQRFPASNPSLIFT
ncbi:unnamed protein product [Ilex paraguariensis]|uniref:Uncharacterized protein n=1 Tax=Ilex paraguariensis TaxID=185542 RepID=A0ABC8S129_9AQUA